ATQRAAWEASYRAGKSISVNVVVHGWTQADGSLWPINRRVHLASSMLKIDLDMLIAGVTYSLDDQSGTTTTLQLMPPNAFLPEPVVPPDGIWTEVAKGV